MRVRDLITQQFDHPTPAADESASPIDWLSDRPHGPHSAQSWNALLQVLPVAAYITDATGQITLFNPAAVRMWGRTPDPTTEKWNGAWRLRWPDGRPMAHDACAAAVALREGRAIEGSEAIAERPDGSLVRFRAYSVPLRDDTGTLTGAVNTLLEITDSRTGPDLTPYLAAIVDSSDDAIIGKDLQGVITSWNDGATKLFGYTATEAIGNPITMLIPRDRHDEEPEILRRIRLGERIGHYDTVRRRKNGDLIDVSLTVSPVKNAEGKIIGASKIARDITERRRAAAKQELLLREMNHRVKNLFALASGIVSISARYADTPKDMARAVEARLVALARAHDLTMPERGDAATRTDRLTDLGTLLRTILSPYTTPADDAQQHRVALTGPDVPIGGNAITSFALLLHEFATNAAKYGALSAPAGRIDVHWSVKDLHLHLEWCERDGPAIVAPAEEEGFGSWIGRATVRGQLNGTMTHDWRAEGLAIQLVVPLDRLAG